MPDYKTEQEKFWTGEFGDEYMRRNNSETILTSKIVIWSRMLRVAGHLSSVLELGCNIGLNLVALKKLKPSLELTAYEINKTAAEQARKNTGAEIICGSILDELACGEFDLTFTAGVLIHINPDYLDAVYSNLYKHSRRYVLVCEYYNPTPVTVNYRGHEDRLFKRDFAGDLIDKFDMKLVDYGFVYRRDNVAPQDDPTWFLLEK